MANRRVVVRCHHASDLSETEQKDFADDVKSRLDGTGIKGYFISVTGNDWIEWEGDETTIQDKLSEHLNDSRISDHDTLEDTEIGSINLDGWRAHTQPDLHNEL